jgi:hypothetical protein
MEEREHLRLGDCVCMKFSERVKLVRDCPSDPEGNFDVK